MNHLKLHSSQISLDLPRASLEGDVARRPVPPDPHEQDDGLGAARGIMLALALSACMWCIVLATAVYF